ncbi:unnamed protein product [Nezara viridula]|uniref:Uncharacterized protein n=1 Tax=Nezara viridula TaxID=85310 RepID=A0A9P0H388_NEZVI|nr:unnamed protein product [Nezara viridula]
MFLSVWVSALSNEILSEAAKFLFESCSMMKLQED